MWGYQPYYQVGLDLLANGVLSKLGVEDPGEKCFLVGARSPEHDSPNAVCIQPESDEWELSLFDGLLDHIETTILEHPKQKYFYGDERATRDLPEVIRCDSVRTTVKRALQTHEADHSVRCFTGGCRLVDGCYVVPVLQLPVALFSKFRPLNGPIEHNRITGVTSLIESAISVVLSEGDKELKGADPGRRLSGAYRREAEISREAAHIFMYTLAVATRQRAPTTNLFEAMNLLSSLTYEGAEGIGRLIVANAENKHVDRVVTFSEAVSWMSPRWARKLLQMASTEVALVADCESIVGLGTLPSNVDPWKEQNVFEVDFIGHHQWRLRCGTEVLLVCEYGVPRLPQPVFSKLRSRDTYHRLFPEASASDADAFVRLFDAATDQKHGSMMVVASDAQAEAERLRGQGTSVERFPLTPALYARVSAMDGTILIDPQCVCHAIGVILDGQAQPECTPSRGSRYNSGIRYVGGASESRLAVVVSDDMTVDVIPVLRPRIQHAEVVKHIVDLEAAGRDEWRSIMNWLTSHRFYLNDAECVRINDGRMHRRERP